MNEIVTTGMIMSSMPIGEYDRRVEILTTRLGRISAFARGARKQSASLISATRVFTFGEFTLIEGKSAYVLRRANPANYFEELSADMDRTCYGFYFLETAQYFTRENADGAGMLKLLYYSLHALSNEALKKALVRSVFELKTLIINGLCPDSERMFSGKGEYGFAAHTIGGARRAFEYVWQTEPEKLYTFTLTEKAMDEFETIVSRLMKMNVDCEFKSLSLLT